MVCISRVLAFFYNFLKQTPSGVRRSKMTNSLNCSHHFFRCIEVFGLWNRQWKVILVDVCLGFSFVVFPVMECFQENTLTCSLTCKSERSDHFVRPKLEWKSAWLCHYQVCTKLKACLALSAAVQRKVHRLPMYDQPEVSFQCYEGDSLLTYHHCYSYCTSNLVQRSLD